VWEKAWWRPGWPSISAPRISSSPAFDTDPVNATLTQFKDLNAEHLNVLKAGGINEKQFDALVERVCSREGIYIVDTGATTFVPRWHYMLEHQLFHFLMEQGRRRYLPKSLSREDSTQKSGGS
jgi:hypothetical protein